MKKGFLIFGVIASMAAGIFTGCDSSQQRVEIAQVDSISAGKTLGKAQQDSVRESEDFIAVIKTFKERSLNKIRANETRINELRASTAREDRVLREKNNRKIDELDRKNNNLKNEVNEYHGTSKQSWESFKTGVNHDMDELDGDIKDSDHPVKM